MANYKNSNLQSFSLEALLTSKLSKDDLIAPWIIEKIKERERQKQEYEQPRVYIDEPLYEPNKEPEEKPGRGVVIIDINGDDDSHDYNVQ